MPDSTPAGRAAILIVNGFDRDARGGLEEARRFPWIGLCLEQLERHTTRSSYDVLVWDNSFLPEHLAALADREHVSVFSEKADTEITHGRALDRLVRELPDDAEYVVTLDTDSFPIRDGWLENLVGRLRRGTSLAGIWRDEMAPVVRPYVHPSCLAIRRDTLLALGMPFLRKGRVEVAQNLTTAVVSAGGRISRLRRSNVRNVHFVLGGVYGDIVYHHGAGSRRAKFHTKLSQQMDNAVRVGLRDAAFEDIDGLIEFLTGDAPAESPDQLGSTLTVRRSRIRRLGARAMGRERSNWPV
ncbi:MAG TPA: hypothetical protein VFR63_01415 [Gaiellaceae bacterium]|nr:hypothetical protein [Gaiellaceae bacterium]